MTERVLVPDVGEAEDVEVIEILVSEGDMVTADSSLVVLESDKASMEIPSSLEGKITTIIVKMGDKVVEGDPIVEIEPVEGTESGDGAKETKEVPSTTVSSKKVTSEAVSSEAVSSRNRPSNKKPAVSDPDRSPIPVVSSKVHAGPAVRRQARELGVELSRVRGTGQRGRILKEDVKAWVKQQLSERGGVIPAVPLPDFSKFGTTRHEEMSRIKKASAKNLHRSWLNVPHVTQHDDADITLMEAYRKSQNEELSASGVKLTPLAFLIRASVLALKAFPRFNASLDEKAEGLIIKSYYNIGIAVDTKEGLMVPVLREADKKDLLTLASESASLAAAARENKLPLNAMQGGTFSISSLGGIGGTAFTPIINAPELAILGVSRSVIRPEYRQDNLEPRLMLPLSLSYDHRAIDGAEAARFTQYLAQVLGNIEALTDI